MLNRNRLALLFVLFMALTLMTFGLRMLTLPDVVRSQQWPYYLLPRGEAMIAAAMLIAAFYRRAAHYLLWISGRLYRAIAALLVFALIGADGLLHALSIPHVEGWWLPLASGLIAASGVGAWVGKCRKHRSHKQPAYKLATNRPDAETQS